jgi:hypothetical protein
VDEISSIHAVSKGTADQAAEYHTTENACGIGIKSGSNQTSG